MEEQILKIIKSHCVFKIWPVNTAKEITSHVMEFIEWIGENCFKYDNDGNGWLVITDGAHDIELGNTEQAYQYWLTNIKNK